MGRHASLAAAVMVTVGANIVLAGLLGMAAIATGQSAAGSFAAGTAVAGIGMVFAGVASITVQLATTTRAANGLAAAVLGFAFALSGVGNILGTVDRALDACCLAQPVDAVGHSMAGLALLAYTLQRPHRISRLVLIGTGSGGPAYMRAPGTLWNRSHPGFAGAAALGLLFYAWPRRAPEALLNNYITRG